MLAKVISGAVMGVEAYRVEIEVNAGRGDTNMVLVGLPDTAVKESKDRVLTALTNSGFKFHIGKLTAVLAQVELPRKNAENAKTE
jgi:magnesium chelatase family protein